MEIEDGKIALFDRGEGTGPGEDTRPAIRQMIDGPNHGPLGPSHFGSIVEPEYPYQLEELFREVTEDHPQVICAEACDGRRWDKIDGVFVRAD